MRSHHAGKVAAVLAALAAFAWVGVAALREMEARRPPLTLTVLSGAADAQAAVQQMAQQPRVLIYHTHTWEAYEMTETDTYTPTETWRTKDDAHNMVRVGEELAGELRERGFFVVHDTTAFEPPNLSDAYTRSLEMLEERLDAGEQYDYLFDVHRDAYSGLYNGSNCAQQGGLQMAYVMMLVGKGTGATGSGFDERPDWPQNLELAQQITDEMNRLVTGLSRDDKVKTGRFNQHVSTGALLIEVGNNKNTLEEALAACPVIAQAIANVHAQRTQENEPEKSG